MTNAIDVAEGADFNEFMCDYCSMPVGECADECEFWAANEEANYGAANEEAAAFCEECCHVQHSGEFVNYQLKCNDCAN